MGEGLKSAKQGIYVLSLANLTNLKSLDLSFNEISTSLASLGSANLTNLKILDLQSNQINNSLASLGICELMDLVELDLKHNNFGGQVPQCLTNFTYLKALVLSSNQLSGTLPSAFTQMKSLEYLDVQENNFEGKYSLSSWANHSKLQAFALSSRNNTFQVENEIWFPAFQLKALKLTHCNLHAIPSFLLYQYDLLSLDLSYNKLVGTFPSWLLVNNTNLRGMYLVNNSFSGTLKLPNTKHDSIDVLDVSHNNFSGQLPKNISKIFSNSLGLLHMSDNCFEGKLPLSMCEMKELMWMDLSNNHFSGELPSDFLIGCFSLAFLNLSNNNFHGQIFPQYMNLPSLSFIYLNNNNFSGNIGKGIQNFTSLEVLDISNNKISGQVPNWIGNFSNLVFLLMSKNLLEGNIPVQLSKLSSLAILDVSENRLIGPITSSFNFSFIQELFMQKNAFTGPIPKSLFRSSKLLMLNLRDNQFSGSNHLQGPIPNQLCQLRNLSILDLSDNRLNGTIPSCLIRMIFWTQQSDIPNEDRSTNDLALEQGYMFFSSNHRFEVKFLTKNRYDSYKGDILNFMTGMDLSKNDLIGDIPSEIGDLQGIKALNLSNNFLSKSIPKSFSNLKSIESLDLSHNKLSGQIPQQLTELNYLEVFNVSYNSLSGPTPNEGQFATFGESSYIGNSGLCITLVNKSCTSAPTPPLLPSNGEEGEESAIDMVAFYWSFFGSYVTIILGLLVILWINSRWRMLWFYYIGECIDLCFYWLSKYVSC
ncbi:hypothetical protein Patl1_35223 [Pistacia atlantica]|uniref:Uncharacterized protein n=1 Tax=Pistacia atlantica TaxID=434234 RepID=A0ACC0ZW82_9ROSI|nr:hypothetical protein Patl1_35223 [Pistacia atlantica]